MNKEHCAKVLAGETPKHYGYFPGPVLLYLTQASHVLVCERNFCFAVNGELLGALFRSRNFRRGHKLHRGRICKQVV